MNSDKPHSLAIAYGMKRRAAKKMASGGMVRSEEPAEEHEGDSMSYSKDRIVDSIMKSRVTEGEMPEDESEMFHEEQEDDGDSEDFLSAEEQDSLPEEPLSRRSRIISGILSSLKNRR